MRYSLLMDGIEAASVVVPVSEAAPTSEVVSIDPVCGEVPFNLLRIYIAFSAPMSEGLSSQAVHVRHADTGAELPEVFLPMEPELWDGSRQRLTLLLDPGRIKRGLGRHGDAGYPLTEGAPVSVGVDQSFRDAKGHMLRRPVQRRYQVGAAIRKRVDPYRWRLAAPQAGSRSALVAVFDRPLDRAMLRRFLTVVDCAAAPVPGRASLDESHRTWRFTPCAPWRAGAHSLLVDPRLEDVAGNSVRRVFDRDLRLPDNDPLEVERVELPLTVE
jgi:hypothetical protein